MATTTNHRGLIKPTQTTKKPYFVGFNTVDQLRPPYSLTNIELVKQDINNQFATPVGSRLNVTDIWDKHL